MVQEFYAAYAREDVDGFLSLWTPTAPDLTSQKIATPETFAELEQIRVKQLSIRQVDVQGDRASVLFDVELAALEVLTGKPPAEQRNVERKLYAVRESGGWKVWREVSLPEDLALQLVEASSDAERDEVLAKNEESVTIDVRKALVILAARQYWHGNNTRALEIYRIAGALAERMEDDAGRADVSLGIAKVESSQGDLGAARRHLDEALHFYQEVSDPDRSSEAFWELANVARTEGDYTAALEDCQRSLEFAERAGSTDARLSTLITMGAIHSELGNYDSALAAYQAVPPLFERLQRPEGIGYAVGLIGNVRFARGDYAGALEAFHRSMGAFESVADSAAIAESLSWIGQVHAAQGDDALALSFFERSLSLSEASGSKTDAADALRRIGDAQRALAQFGPARQSYERALALAEGAGAVPAVVAVLGRLGALHEEHGRPRESLEAHERALRLAESMGSKASVAESLLLLGSLLVARGRHVEACEHLERAVDVARGLGLADTLWRAQTAVGSALTSLGQTMRAQPALEEAVEVVESLRDRVAGGELEQQRFFEGRVAPYHALVSLLVSQGRNAEALAWAERAKARVLLDVLERGRLELAKALTASEREQERSRREQLVSLNTQIHHERLKPKPDVSRLENLGASVQEARREYQALQSVLHAAQPDLLLQRGPVTPASVREASELLRDGGSALLEYLVTEGRTYLFVLTQAPEPLRVYSLEIGRKELTERVSAFREQLGRRDLNVQRPAASLHDVLLGPAHAQLRGMTNLVIVPDDVLWDLPFQALSHAGDRYLLQDHAVSYAPSITALRAMAGRGKKHSGPSTLLALGNPVPRAQTVQRVQSLYRDAALASLPHAQREVKKLAQLYGTERSRVYVGVEVSEERAKAGLRDVHSRHGRDEGVGGGVDDRHGVGVLVGNVEERSRLGRQRQ